MKKTFWLLIFSSGLTFALGTQNNTTNILRTSSIPSSSPIDLKSTTDSHGGDGSQVTGHDDDHGNGNHGGDHDRQNGTDDGHGTGQGNHHQGNITAYEYL